MAALRLSLPPTAGIGIRIAIGVLLTAAAAGCLILAYDWTVEPIPYLLANPPDSVGSTLRWLWVWLWVFVYGLGGSALPVWGIAWALRARDTLDGTVLTVRTAFRTRSADLAEALVRGDTTSAPDEVALVAMMPGTGQHVRLRLGDSGGLLPRPQLAALADAIAAGGVADERRRVVVDRLRLYVRQPFAVPRYLWADPPPLPRR